MYNSIKFTDKYTINNNFGVNFQVIVNGKKNCCQSYSRSTTGY